jgi:hypothetical protein
MSAKYVEDQPGRKKFSREAIIGNSSRHGDDMTLNIIYQVR